jgi:energy-coupling factor transporter ATP-binding protein EcfA2
MNLVTFEYTANQGLPSEWKVEKCQFSRFNLIIGKNVSGKSRLLKAIGRLTDLLRGVEIVKTENHEWRVLFDTGKPNYYIEYSLKIQEGLVNKEQLIVCRDASRYVLLVLLDRNQLGESSVWAENLQEDVKFQVHKTKTVIAEPENYIQYRYTQYPFLELLYFWSSRINFYNFGTTLNKSVIPFISGDPALDISKTVVVDDFGCRLDHESSPIIAKYLVEYSNRSPAQFILTTNNQFVVNSVPLDCLSIIERSSNIIKLHNIFNSREKFEEFKFIGLNNFDLFTSEFLL